MFPFLLTTIVVVVVVVVVVVIVVVVVVVDFWQLDDTFPRYNLVRRLAFRLLL